MRATTPWYETILGSQSSPEARHSLKTYTAGRLGLYQSLYKAKALNSKPIRTQRISFHSRLASSSVRASVCTDRLWRGRDLRSLGARNGTSPLIGPATPDVLPGS